MKRILLTAFILLSFARSFATVWTITNSGFSFTPTPLTITQGDTVNFVLNVAHNAQEVSQATWNANNFTPLPGFQTPFGGGMVTGLTVGTHYYVCANHSTSSMKGIINVQAQILPVFIPNVWINELHYDNAGSDTLEGYEIAGPAGTDLSCYRVFLYNGLNGQLYATQNLSGVIPDLACGYGAVWFGLLSNGMQNGDVSQTQPDGIVLEYAPNVLACGMAHTDTILQFLSYEGSFTATNGRALGLSSTNIGVAETSTSTPDSTSLQLAGIGTSYEDFSWAASSDTTHNRVNNNQFFCGGPQASYRFTTTSATYAESAGTIVAGYIKATNVSAVSQSVSLVIKGGSGTGADINNFSSQTFTFSPGGVDSVAVNITITDDLLVEGTENIIFALRNPTNSGTIEADSLFTLTITDNDVAPNPSIQFILNNASGGEGVGSFQVALSITNPNANPTQVDVNVLGGGTATFGSDFTYSPITVTFPGGSGFSQFVTINIADDVIAEGNEAFIFQLANPTNGATIGTNAQQLVTIIDNDTLRFNISPASQTVNENAGVITLPVTLSHVSPNSTSVTVHLETIGTTATQGADFVFNDTTLVWPAGSTGQILLPIAVLDDALLESNERIKLRLINPTNGALFVNDTAQIIILSDDTLNINCVDLFFSEYIEGSSNNKALEIYNPTSSSINLSNYRIFKSTNGGTSSAVFGLSGTLAPNSVYVVANSAAAVAITSQADTLSGFFNFTGNDALALLHFNDTIDVIGQIGVDPVNGWIVDTGSTENHTLLRNYYNYRGDTSWSAAALSWDIYPVDMFDSLGAHHIAPCGTIPPVPPATIRFTIANMTVQEESAVIQVIIRVDNPGSVPVDYFVARDDNAATALPGADFNFSNRHFVSNTSGTTFDTVEITVLEDLLLESTETVVLHFVNVGANNLVVQDSIFILFIEDEDTLTVSFAGAGFGYVEQDTIVNVRVKISTFTADTTRVNVALAPGSAINGVDFIFNDTTLVFLPNSTDTQSAWITLIDDNLVESNEQINFDLWDATNGAHIGLAAFTLTIIDNDSVIVGMANVDFDNTVKMFPNPARNILVIETQDGWQNAEVRDLLGKVLIQIGNLGAGKNIVDVSLLPEGMYFLNMRNESKLYSKRFIKQD